MMWLMMAAGVDADALTMRRQIAETSLQTGSFYPSVGVGQTYEHTVTLVASARDLVIGVDASVASGAASVVINSQVHPLTFSGQPSFGKSATSAPTLSDPVEVILRAGTLVTCRLYYEAADVQHPAAKSLGIDPAYYGAGDLTITGGTTSHNNSQRFLPTFVSITGLADPAQVSVLGIGDSIFESGSGNPTGYTLGCRQAGVPFLNAGRWGGQTISSGDVGLSSLPASFTHVLDEYGFNDITNEPVTKTMQDKLATWAWTHAQNAALRITACTITPSASSTDSWTTLDGQAPDAGTTYDGLTRWQRASAYNDWLRDGAPILAGTAAPATTDPAALRAGQAGHPLDSILDIAAVIESSPNSGIFRVDHGQISIDGAHMNSTAGDLIAASVRAWAASLTV